MADISKITDLNGTTYDIKDATARAKINNAGGIQTANGKEIAIPHNTITNLSSITLDSGRYIIEASGHFAANGTGYRQIGIAGSRSANSLDGRLSIAKAPAFSGSAADLTLTFPYITSAGITLYLNAVQTSGGDLNGYGSLRAMRIAAY